MSLSPSSIRDFLSRMISRRLAEARHTLMTAKLTIQLSRSNWGLMSGFILLAMVNALTDSFSIMLIVPLLESFSPSSVFGGVPLLEELGALMQGMSPVSRLRWAAGLVLAIIVIKGLAQYLLDVIVYIVPLRIERNLRINAFMAMMQSNLSFAESMSSGEIGNYTASFPARAGIAARFLMQLVAAMVTIGLILSLLLAITPVALLALAAFAVFASFLFRALTSRLSKRLDLELTQSQQQFTQAYFEAVNNKRTIRVFNATDIFLHRITRLLERLRKVQALTIGVQNATYPFFSTLAGLLVCSAVLAASFYQPERAQALLGVMLVFLVAATRLLGPFSILHIANMHFGIHSEAVVQLDRFFKDAEFNRDRDGNIELGEGHPAVAFENVSFHYPGTSVGVTDVSFKVAPGDFVALVGPSGAGKSTIFHLVSRLHRPQSGKVTADSVDLRDAVARSWWEKISIVSQDVPIFNATVRENIHFGVEGTFDEGRMEEALKLAAADEFVAEMPNGLDSTLGEFGSTLSGGQRQRLALARAFYHRKPIILLDEVTSQLDPPTERRISASIQKLRADGHTILAIAHRLSTVRNADTILVFDEGRLVDQGAPDRLLRTNAFVKSMLQEQAEAS